MSDDSTNVAEWRGWKAPTVYSLATERHINLSVMGILLGWPRHKVATWVSRPARRALLREGPRWL